MLEQADCCTNSNKDNEELTTPKCALRWPEAWKRGERGWRRGSFSSARICCLRLKNLQIGPAAMRLYAMQNRQSIRKPKNTAKQGAKEYHLKQIRDWKITASKRLLTILHLTVLAEDFRQAVARTCKEIGIYA
jgi:hypothetical protein